MSIAGNKIKVVGKQISSSELTSYLAQKPSASFLGIRRPGAPLVIHDESQVQTSADNIENHLEYIGYYGSKVTSEVDYQGKKAYVTYFVTPGKRYTIRSIDYELPQDEEFRKEFETDRPNITIKEGQYLAESTLEAETVRSAEFFRNRGYYGFDKSFYFCEADTLSHDGTAALTMAIRDYPRNGSADEAKPHRKFTIGDVTLSYPKEIPIRTYVLEELNVLRPGMPYSERAVNATYSRLSNLSVFNSVNVTMNPVSDNVVDCDINLLNGGVQGFKANLEASVNSTGLFGISPQLNYFHKNFFHGGELFNLGLKGNFQFKTKDKIRSTEFSVSSSLRIPKLIGLPNSLFRGPNLPHTDITLGFSYQDRPEYKRTMITTSFGYTGNLGRNFYYQFFPFQANIVRLFSVSESFAERLVSDLFLLNAYSDHFDMGMGGMLYYTTDPTPIPKRTAGCRSTWQAMSSACSTPRCPRTRSASIPSGRFPTPSMCAANCSWARPSVSAAGTTRRWRSASWWAPDTAMATPPPSRSRSSSMPAARTACAAGRPAPWARPRPGPGTCAALD